MATKTQSPEQVAARAEPPAPVPVVAELVEGQLQPPISMSATSKRERAVAVRRVSNGETVTAVEVPVGGQVNPGSVLVRANGRPVFAVPGAFAFYRDLGGGDVGDDVAQLQSSLHASGYETGTDRPGVFGAGTKAAVAALYRAAGFEPATDDLALRGEISAIDELLAGAPQDRTLQATRAALVARLGPRALAEEFATAPELPATVESIASLGSSLDEGTPLAVLGAGDVVLTATVPTSVSVLLVAGAAGTFATEATGPQSATVRNVGPAETDDEATVTFATSAQVPLGVDVVVRVDNPGAETEDRVLAPASAIVSRGGRSLLYLRNQETFREVEVTVTGTAGGVAAIVPVDDDIRLRAGDEVRVGSR